MLNVSPHRPRKREVIYILKLVMFEYFICSIYTETMKLLY